MNPPKRKVRVFVVSDATGITAERVIRAVLAQFHRRIEPVFERFPYVKTTRRLQEIVDQAEAQEGVLIYSLVAPELREWIRAERRQREIEIIDLLGPLLDQMVKLFNVMPLMHPGLLGILGEESLRLAESIDFTLRHDDGHGLETLGQADLIILGVSRTSKTPTSLYLSCNHNLKVANVPLILKVKPPRKIFTLKRPRKVGFTVAPEKLAQIRGRRYKEVALPGYTDLKTITQELAYSHEIFAQIEGLQVVDVTHAPIEEIARLILERRI